MKLGPKYTTYKEGLKILKMQTLNDRREALSLSFAKRCLRNEKFKRMFPIRKMNHKMKKRNMEKFKNLKANTKRYEKSAVPYMRRKLNKEWKKLRNI